MYPGEGDIQDRKTLIIKANETEIKNIWFDGLII